MEACDLGITEVVSPGDRGLSGRNDTKGKKKNQANIRHCLRKQEVDKPRREGLGRKEDSRWCTDKNSDEAAEPIRKHIG